jgi:ubiquinol-cytochrome c reductase cytochrome b subunit
MISLPRPINISSFWNFGFLLRFCLIIQIVTGLFLSMHYSRDMASAFRRVDHIFRDVNYGWVMRIIHRNTARMFFFCMYIHTGRGIYYESYYLIEVWNIGVMILLLRMATAFLGYVLPWGQMSLWGATVITNLFSVIPFIGGEVVQWLWGGFSIDSATLMRFFSFHFLFPFLILRLVIIHLMFLHQTGSTNPLGVDRNFRKITFHPFFSYKDFTALMVIFILLFFLVFFYPWILADPENFIPANPLVTPVHIQPEWYFLFAYAILRSIPNKVGGVVALLMSILILFIIPLINKKAMKGRMFYTPTKIIFWVIVSSVLVLTWIGARPVEGRYIFIGQVSTLVYFARFILSSLVRMMWDLFLRRQKT